ncbi:MAG TPA: iron ABC transporter [Planctomycetaceae bacterium]|nr:iron ABC transporter [Planctomycetaceae bacterium]
MIALLSLRDYNTRVVVIGTALLGAASGIVGTFTLLRKRALTGDALSHATLPGIAIAFMVGVWMGGDGKSMPQLLAGATVSGLLGVLCIAVLRKGTRLKEDTALGIVLSVFFGAGIALLGITQQFESGDPAGLEGFVLGKAASMRSVDAWMIGGVASLCLVVCGLGYKELRLLCFDDAFAGSRGYPVLLLDLVLMATVVGTTIVGLRAVGLVLMIALLIIPAAAARFWTDGLWQMILIAALIGSGGAIVGAGSSALLPRLPSGAMIVLSCASLFMVSLVFGKNRGLVVRLWRRLKLNATVDRHHLLRSLYEFSEAAEETLVDRRRLLEERSWVGLRLHRCIRACEADGLVVSVADQLKLTPKGCVEAKRLTREHRLWELYLIAHADIAPARVDRAADRIEHVLEPEVIAELESLLEQQEAAVPRNPHAEVHHQEQTHNGEAMP